MSKITEDFPGGALLIAAGYTTAFKVHKATDEELLTVPGIGPSSLEKIRAATAEPADAKPVALYDTPYACPNPKCGQTITVSPCPYCGQ